MYVPIPLAQAATAAAENTTVLRTVSSGGGSFFCGATIAPIARRNMPSPLKGWQATFYRGTVQKPGG